MDSKSPHLAVNGVVADFGAHLLLDSQGRTIPLRPQSFAVLRHLAANPGRLVRKAELMAAVWRGVAVTDDSLVKCIGEIRGAIGDDKHTIVRTVPREGYRLVLPDPPPTAQWRSRLTWILGAGVVGGLALIFAAVSGMQASRPVQVPLVAVVPFEPLSEDPSSLVLARGLTEDVISDLARADEFEVLAGDATAVYREPNPRQVAIDLDASYVVAGTISGDGDRIRISAALHDARGRVLWTDRWDRPARDFFADSDRDREDHGQPDRWRSRTRRGGRQAGRPAQASEEPRRL
jgi:TolB-like protein